ncbi:MAG: homocysteine S-methyltransferase family protein [Nocardioides sp.]
MAPTCSCLQCRQRSAPPPAPAWPSCAEHPCGARCAHADRPPLRNRAAPGRARRGLATRLEARGHDLSDQLWSARLLLDEPEEVRAAHADFFAVGAEVAITASYQVSFAGLAARGVDRAGTERLLRLSVTLAREAAEAAGDERWVAASVGPYGAALEGGQEYVGDYDLDGAGLRAWHRPRLAVLAEAGADLLAVETVPSLAEVEAVLAEVADLGCPAGCR